METEYCKLITRFFGSEFLEQSKRNSSFTLLENIVNRNMDADGNVNTVSAIMELREIISEMTIQEFSFLLTHSGNIPDHYPPDSSLETLHSKLTETLVAEWGELTGAETELVKEKSNREDIKLTFNDRIIVCDAKSFRLGRSQPAPNVKDVIKRGDYEKWLSAYPEHKRLGGIVTLPSLHDWKVKSDVYSYCSDKEEPILMIHYEHLAYILLNWDDKKSLHIDTILSSYSQIFPNSSKKRNDYWSKVEPMISRISNTDDLREFIECSDFILQDSVIWAKNHIIQKIEKIKQETNKEVEQLPEHILRNKLIEIMVKNKTKRLERYVKNIDKFR